MIGLNMSLAPMQRQDYASKSRMISMQPLFDLSLEELDELKSYVEHMSESEREDIGSPKKRGSGKKAFKDVKLETLIDEGCERESSPADVRVHLNREGAVELEYLAGTNTEPIKESSGAENGALIRNAKTLLEQINWTQATVRKIYDIVLARQENYLATEDPAQLRPISQKEIAEEIGVSDSTVSRLLDNKYVGMVDGDEMPLKSLVIGQEGIDRLRVYGFMGRKLRDDTYPKNDEEMTALVKQEFGLDIKRRTIAKYRLHLEGKMKGRSYRRIH